MVPVLEHNIGGDGPQMLEEPIRRAACDDGVSPAITASLAAVWNAKASRLSVTRTEARVSLPCPKLCSRLYPLVLSTLKVSFSIFHRARPQAASSATVPAVTGRSVMKLL